MVVEKIIMEYMDDFRIFKQDLRIITITWRLIYNDLVRKCSISLQRREFSCKKKLTFLVGSLEQMPFGWTLKMWTSAIIATPEIRFGGKEFLWAIAAPPTVYSTV